MMQFTQIPENHAPLGDRLLYHFEDPGTGGDHLFQLFDLDTDDTLAARRYSRCDKGDVDIAAILRPLVRFTPSVGATGFFEDAGRVSHVQARIDIAYSEERLFLPVMEERPSGTDAERPEGSAVAFGMRTTMPLCRLIAPDEAEEVTLFAEEPLTVEVTACGSDGQSRSRSYTSGQGGWQLFRLDMADFADAERVTLAAGELGSLTYTVAPSPHGSRRLAWRSAAGSVEHYTFPFETVVAKQTAKKRVYGASGRAVSRVTSERLVTLRSAFERREVMEALAEIISSPEVWLVCAGRYLPVDVVTSEVEINRNGTYDALEIAIRPTVNESML